MNIILLFLFVDEDKDTPLFFAAGNLFRWGEKIIRVYMQSYNPAKLVLRVLSYPSLLSDR